MNKPTVVVDRSTWWNGFHKNGEVALCNKYGFKCIFGFIANQVFNITYKDLNLISFKAVNDSAFTDFHRSIDADNITCLNDACNVTMESTDELESKLIEAFMDKIILVFTGSFNPEYLKEKA